MSDESFKDPNHVLHAAKLWTTPADMVGRRVTGHIGSSTFSAFVLSCTIEKGAMTLELSLSQYAGRKVRALVYGAPDNAWQLDFQKSSLDVDRVEFSAT